jgi:hypothetical protein
MEAAGVVETDLEKMSADVEEIVAADGLGRDPAAALQMAADEGVKSFMLRAHG